LKKQYAIVFSAIVSLLFLSFLSIHSAMALMIEIPTSELTSTAEAIVRGTVKDMKSEWDEERKFIWTLVTISVSKSIKGDRLEQQDIIVKIPGGIVGEIGQQTDDAPIFNKGEDVLLFLKSNIYKGQKVFHVRGNFQGKHTIKDNIIIEKKIPIDTFIGQIKSAM
jgi:hypothetical protein